MKYALCIKDRITFKIRYYIYIVNLYFDLMNNNYFTEKNNSLFSHRKKNNSWKI